jgi:hypothetical protein
VLALDAKLNFDDNALYRHKELVELRDIHEEDPLDVEASKYSLNYIKLDGNVACMVNGAGLAMATMDIVKLSGGEPANFLDVGGGASPEQIENAFRILSSDPSVKAVFINVFGGILRVDRLAEGIIGAVAQARAQPPGRAACRGHERRSGQADARRVRPAADHGRRHGRWRAQGRGPREGADAVSVLVDRNTRVVVQGHHRQGRRVPRRALQGVRHQGRRRRDARQGGHHARGLRGVEHGRGGSAEGRRRLRADLRAATGRRRRHHGGGRRRVPLVICITEGIPSTDMVRAKHFVNGTRAGSSAQLPGRHHAGQAKIGIMPGTSTRPARSAWSRAAER